MAMLERVPDLSLAQLNEATLAWAEMECNRKVHSETGQTPLERWTKGKDVGRECPSAEVLRLRFTQIVRRTQRKSDGTVSIEGVRFEVPSRFRHLDRITVRYARWDLAHVWIWDEVTGKTLVRIFPLDKTRVGFVGGEPKCCLCRMRHKKHYAASRVMPRGGRQRALAMQLSAFGWPTARHNQRLSR
jgi:hypothetical protein